MPVPVPELGSYNFVQETKEDLPWADLITLDFSLYGTPEGNQQLAKTLIKAVREDGFFYVKNFNISQERVNRQFAIGKQLYETPLEEKLNLDPVSGLRDRVEVYNIPKFNGDFKHEHPEAAQQHLPEIEEFARSLHTEVLDPLHTILAIALGLPEDYLKNIHKYEVKSEDHLRYMKYGKFSPEENQKLNGLWGRGHTDLGTFTLLFRQPVAALQIRNHTTGEWSWVKPQDGTLTVNTCDALSFLTAGYVKSTVHRVAVPPKDQQHVDRLGLLYFSRPNNDVELKTIKESPVLREQGFVENEFEKSGNPVPTMETWTFAKQKWQRTKNVARGDKKFENAQILPGWNEKVYA
ncbi:hypothetical protein ONZ51_g876 [Trametes cubensis]|uniref:Clavaminate synthase-like protein n=1 Tax=Trametes cubensis TaxID=1111947 RepID=A0AAD7U4U6_9APHY|nr:hypothetical protein ONZ51_g876 [Trametes cubensis]